MSGLKHLSCGAQVATLALACTTSPPDLGLPYRQEAESQRAVGNDEAAVAAYRVALSIEPADLEARRGLLDAQIAVGQGEAALRTLASLELLDPKPFDPCPALALVITQRLERSQDATAPAKRSLAAGCGDSARQMASDLARRGRQSAVGGNRSAAIASFTRAIELDSSQPSYYLDAAELLIAERRTGEAVALLASGLEHHPSDRLLRNLMVRALSIR